MKSFLGLAMIAAFHAHADSCEMKSTCQEWMDARHSSISDISSDAVGNGKAHLPAYRTVDGCDVDPNDYQLSLYSKPFKVTVGRITLDGEKTVLDAAYEALSHMPVDSVLYFSIDDKTKCRCEKGMDGIWECDPKV